MVSEHRRLGPLANISNERGTQPRLTQAHRDAITVSPGMKHVLIGSHTKVAKHLHGLSILDLNVSLLHYGFHEMLVNELPESAPQVAVLHDQQVVAPCDQLIPNVRFGSMAVFRALLIHYLLHKPSVGNDDRRAGSHLQGVESPVLLCPFCEPVILPN